MQGFGTRALRASVVLAAIVAVTAVAATTSGPVTGTAKGDPPAVPHAHAAVAQAHAAVVRAHAAAVLNVSDEGRLRFITSYGSELIDEGPASGSVPGRVKVHFVYNGDPNVTAQFTIYAAAGTISGRGKATLSNPTSPKPSFRGTFQVVGGSGRYRRIGGSGGLYGVFTRRGYGLVVQTVGRLRY